MEPMGARGQSRDKPFAEVDNDVPSARDQGTCPLPLGVLQEVPIGDPGGLT